MWDAEWLVWIVPQGRQEEDAGGSEKSLSCHTALPPNPKLLCPAKDFLSVLRVLACGVFSMH